MTYMHGEAFCLMTYRSDDGTEEEAIWNSRDGVTPFVITLRSGKQASHVGWRSDRRVPDYQPPKGSRMFVDLTPERRKLLARRNAQRYFPNALGITEARPELAADAKREFGTVERMAEYLMDQPIEQGAPDLIEVE